MSTPTPPAAAPADAPRRGLGGRLHAALLMPDYNGKATAFWWTVVALGTAVVGHALASLAGRPWTACLEILAGIVVAMLAGVFPVRIPNSKNSFVAGEIFVFLLLLMHGPAAATLAAASETAFGAWRTSRRWTSRIASPAMSALALFAAGSLFTAGTAALQRLGWLSDGMVVAAMMVFAVGHFGVNALLATALPLLKRNERLLWMHVTGLMGWIGFVYAGSAAVAALLFLAYRTSGLGVLVAVVPLLGALLAAFHYYNRQQEASEAARVAVAAAEREAQALAHAAEREAELAARHLRELEASERRFHSAFTHASIGMALLAFDGQVLQANGALHQLLGLDDGALRGARFGGFVLDGDQASLAAQLARVEDRGFENFSLELRCRHRNGDTVWTALHCSFFSEPGAATPSLILQVQDITARRRAEQGLQDLAFNDTLTGLPNRRRFHELLTQAVARCAAAPEQRFAVLFLDFDRFKLINDSLGHSAGDEFLVQVSRRIQGRLSGSDVVARLGGDEFAILMQRFDGDEVAVAMADRLLLALKEPFRVADTELSTSASIGITTSRIGYTDPESVLRDADIAMYRAKAGGKARHAVFDIGLHAEAARRLRMESDLRAAIEQGALAVAYQPLYELKTARLTGFEALARWTHPEQGPIGPDQFIPVAEETGLIVPMTTFMLREACRQLHEWQALDPAFRELGVQVNLAGRDLAHSGLAERVLQAVGEAGIQPRHLTLELTEDILMSRIEVALPQLERLRALGVKLAVDDFGTGYSSLAHLSRLPIDALKVDRSFVRHLTKDSKDAAVVRGIVQLGRSLGKDVVAEGIETPSQFDQLRDMGCDRGQGYLMARPMNAAQAATLLLQMQESSAHPMMGAEFRGEVVLH
ncbi:MAG: EAL domain-containing protein [Burkholderiaceae bacterium]|nr:EAL domain-containing protein [Burkholderiaceae bacterium]